MALERWLFGKRHGAKPRVEVATRKILDDVIEGRDNLTKPINEIPIPGINFLKSITRVAAKISSVIDNRPVIQSVMDIHAGAASNGNAKRRESIKHSSRT